MQIAALFQREMERKRSNPFRLATDAGVPESSVRAIFNGHEPKVGRVAEICRALGLEFYIGPPRDPSLGERVVSNIAEQIRRSGLASEGDFSLVGLDIFLQEMKQGQHQDPEQMASCIMNAAIEYAQLKMISDGTRNSKHWAEETVDILMDEIKAMHAELLALRTGVSDLTDASALTEFCGDGDPPGAHPVDVLELASAAGGGAEVLSEERSGRLWFRRDWLDTRGLMARSCVVIGVSGESMEPTLWDGSKILINRSDTRRRVDEIFVVRTPDGLVVKRAGKDPDGNWLLVSDHPAWDDVAWPDEAEVIGRVMWTARNLT